MMVGISRAKVFSLGSLKTTHSHIPFPVDEEDGHFSFESSFSFLVCHGTLGV